MNKKTLIIFISAISFLSIATISYAAINLNSSRSNVYRIINPNAMLVSISTDLSSQHGHETQTIYTTQATGDFVITNFCASPVFGGMRLAAEGLGSIAQTTDNNLCYTFSPGIVIPHTSAITCSTTNTKTHDHDGAVQPTFSAPHFCTISGFFSPDIFT